MADPISWGILVVDDDPKLTEQIQTILDGKEIVPGREMLKVTRSDFTKYLQDLDTYQVDLIVLDVRAGPIEAVKRDPEEAGELVLRAIREKRYIPVIFYSAISERVRELGDPLTKIVQKSTDHGILLVPIKEIFARPFVAINRALTDHMQKIQAKYMHGFVVEHWEQFGRVEDQYELAHLWARRMALSLSNEGIKLFLKQIGAPSYMYDTDSTVHPMQYYIIPPIENTFLPGDLFYGEIEKETSFWCLLTPACDFILHKGKMKAEWALFAKCVLLSDQPEYKDWIQELDKIKKITEISKPIHGKFISLLTDNRQDSQKERFSLLPGVLDIPDLIIDFQQLKILKMENNKLNARITRKASLDSPFSEALINRFMRYFGRIGTPDLNCECVLSRLSER